MGGLSDGPTSIPWILKFWYFSPFLIHAVKGGVERSRDLTIWYSEAICFIV